MSALLPSASFQPVTSCHQLNSTVIGISVGDDLSPTELRDRQLVTDRYQLGSEQEQPVTDRNQLGQLVTICNQLVPITADLRGSQHAPNGFLTLFCAILLSLIINSSCTAQNLLSELQGRWVASTDTTQVIVIKDSTWMFSSPQQTSPYTIRTREWVVDHDDGERQIVHDEAILISPNDTITITIDCACGDELYLSGSPFPKGAIYRRME